MEEKLYKLITDVVDRIEVENNVNYNQSLSQTAVNLANTMQILKGLVPVSKAVSTKK
jgi:hypothetical protein